MLISTDHGPTIAHTGPARGRNAELIPASVRPLLHERSANERRRFILPCGAKCETLRSLRSPFAWAILIGTRFNLRAKLWDQRSVRMRCALFGLGPIVTNGQLPSTPRDGRRACQEENDVDGSRCTTRDSSAVGDSDRCLRRPPATDAAQSHLTDPAGPSRGDRKVSAASFRRSE